MPIEKNENTKYQNSLQSLILKLPMYVYKTVSLKLFSIVQSMLQNVL